MVGIECCQKVDRRYMMDISPLLSEEIVTQVSTLLEKQDLQEQILQMMRKLSLVEQIHVLRFLFHQSERSRRYTENIYMVWKALLPLHHDLNTAENRKALY